jgi:hypothetical protein
MHVAENNPCAECNGTDGYHYENCVLGAKHAAYNQRREEIMGAQAEYDDNDQLEEEQQQEQPVQDDQHNPHDVLGMGSWTAANTISYVGQTAAKVEDRVRVKLPNNVYDVSGYDINPVGTAQPITNHNIYQALSQLDDFHKLETDPHYLELRHANAATMTHARDTKACTITLNVAGLEVREILLDTGAQPNLVSIALLMRLGSLGDAGKGIRDAMRGMLKDTRLDSHIVGVGDARTKVIGKIVLPIILSKTRLVPVPFLVTLQVSDAMIIGTPGLRLLGFKLTSPDFGKRDYLDPNYHPEGERAEPVKKQFVQATNPDEILRRHAKLIEATIIGPKDPEPDKSPQQNVEPVTEPITKEPDPSKHEEQNITPKKKSYRNNRKKKGPKPSIETAKTAEPVTETAAKNPNVAEGPVTRAKATMQEQMIKDKETLKENKHLDIDEETGEFVPVNTAVVKLETNAQPEKPDKPEEHVPAAITTPSTDTDDLNGVVDTKNQDFRIQGTAEMWNLF